MRVSRASTAGCAGRRPAARERPRFHVPSPQGFSGSWLTSIVALFEEGGQETYREGVTQLAHALQSGQRAHFLREAGKSVAEEI
jgi:hypothetical protein